MRWVKEVFLYCLVAIVSLLLIPGISKAEIYLGAMGGISLPNDFSDVTDSWDERPALNTACPEWPKLIYAHSSLCGA